MRRVLGTLVAAAVLLSSATQAAAAPATEFGDRCVATDSEADWTLIGLNNGNAFPLQPVAPPETNSVITRWRTELAPGVGPVRQQLLGFRQVYEGQDQLVGESAIETLVDGVNEFSTRIPIPEYGRIGLRGPEQTLSCDKESGHLAGVVEGPFAVGETRPHTWHDAGVPAMAFVEPDRDGDGYGDETQDQCTFNAAYHGVCPIVGFRAGRVQIKRRAIQVQVEIWVTTVIYAVPHVQLSGQIALKGRRTPILLDGGAQDLAGGSGTFRLPLPKSVLNRLGRMSPKRFLSADILADTVNSKEVAGREIARAWTVILHGRKKAPAPRG